MICSSDIQPGSTVVISSISIPWHAVARMNLQHRATGTAPGRWTIHQTSQLDWLFLLAERSRLRAGNWRVGRRHWYSVQLFGRHSETWVRTAI